VGVTDQEFVQQWASTELCSTPLYYQDALQRWPQLHTAAISAIAQARPSGVLFHYIRGYNHTGIIALLLLTLAGAATDQIHGWRWLDNDWVNFACGAAGVIVALGLTVFL
jgi:hypothetical protein